MRKKVGLPQPKEFKNAVDAEMAAMNLPLHQQPEHMLQRIARYTEYMERLQAIFAASGFKVANALQTMADLQSKLWELEDKLREEGKNPLESPEWMKARKLLSEEIQFIQRHGLEGAKFQHALEREKQKGDVDVAFTVASDGN